MIKPSGWRALWADSRVRVWCVAGAAWLVAYAAATALVAHSHVGQLILADLAYHVPLAAAAGAAFYASSRQAGRMRWFWRMIGVSVVLMAVGEGILSFYELVLGREAPTPSLADLFYFFGSLSVIPAVFLGFGGASSDRRNRAWLDAVIVMIGAGAVGWRLLIAPQLAGGFTFAVASQIAYPLLDIALLVVLVSLGFGGHRKVPTPIAIVGLAYAVAVFGDSVYSFTTIHGIFEGGGWIDLTWQIQFVLLTVAGVAARRPADDAQVAAMDRDFGQVPVFLGAALVVLLTGADLRHLDATATVVALGAMVAALLRRYQLTARDLRASGLQLSIAADEQKRLATTDDLTGLYNRRFIVEAFRSALGDSQADGDYIAMLELDIDHFKEINDAHGHDAGDAVLVEVARRLTACVRGDDLVARYGGEEFVVMLRLADPDQLYFVAERWRMAVSNGPIALPDGDGASPTVSIGGACTLAGRMTLDELFLGADRALYEAKATGRNRVAVSQYVPAA